MSVRLDQVSKSFGTTPVVRGISAELRDGEFFVVLGPSGCGKSTLLRLIAGLEQVDGGTISLDGAPVSSPTAHVPPETRSVGVVFQSYALWPHMNVRDNVAFPINAQGARRAVARAEAQDSLAKVALTEFADRLPAELSGGQRQRVALARCLAGGSRTILMDEPLANLDPHLRTRMEGEIHAFHRDAGVTTLFITHDQREAMALADRIAVMWGGRFLQVDAPDVLHDRPATEEVARFIGQSAIIDAEATGSSASAGPLTFALAAPAQGAVRVVVRPGNVRLEGAGIPAVAQDVFYRGGAWEARAKVAGIDEALPLSSSKRLSEGETLRLRVEQGWALPR